MNSDQLNTLCDRLNAARESVEAGTAEPNEVSELVHDCLQKLQSAGATSDVVHILTQTHSRMLFLVRAKRTEEAQA